MTILERLIGDQKPGTLGSAILEGARNVNGKDLLLYGSLSSIVTLLSPDAGPAYTVSVFYLVLSEPVQKAQYHIDAHRDLGFLEADVAVAAKRKFVKNAGQILPTMIYSRSITFKEGTRLDVVESYPQGVVYENANGLIYFSNHDPLTMVGESDLPAYYRGEFSKIFADYAFTMSNLIRKGTY